ncbi:MAG: hypothetical protein R3D99_10135 [Altererythrobacter sp.]
MSTARLIISSRVAASDQFARRQQEFAAARERPGSGEQASFGRAPA